MWKGKAWGFLLYYAITITKIFLEYVMRLIICIFLSFLAPLIQIQLSCRAGMHWLNFFHSLIAFVWFRPVPCMQHVSHYKQPWRALACKQRSMPGEPGKGVTAVYTDKREIKISYMR